MMYAVLRMGVLNSYYFLIKYRKKAACAFTSTMVIFFLIMLIGYICRKVGVFGENTGKMISGIVINIGNPALIIASGMNPETLENKAALLVTLAVALIFFAIMFVIAELIPRLLRADREDYGSYQVMTIFANIALWAILCWMPCTAVKQ